jgi:hypothetical protein
MRMVCALIPDSFSSSLIEYLPISIFTNLKPTEMKNVFCHAHKF